MASQHLFYPLCSVIRYLAKAYLTATPEAFASALVWDETLFDELASTCLQPAVQPTLAASYPSRDEAAVVERQLAQSLVHVYRRIMYQRLDPQIRQLNALL